MNGTNKNSQISLDKIKKYMMDLTPAGIIRQGQDERLQIICRQTDGKYDLPTDRMIKYLANEARIFNIQIEENIYLEYFLIELELQLTHLYVKLKTEKSL